jgi:hypothetical protein
MIDDADDPASLRGALAVADYFRLPALQARAILRDVADAVSRWRDLAALHGLSPSDIAEMGPAFAAVAEADHA